MLSFADLPHWAVMTIVVVLGIGAALFVAAIFGARVRSSALDDGIGRVRLLLVRGRTGLAVMRRPLAAAGAAFFQLLGWVCQLLAVYAAMRGFRIYEPLVAAGLVLLIMNVVTIIPFWPGNIGLVQAAIAVSLAQYGVRYAKGFAFGIGLAADRGLRRDRDRDGVPRARGHLVRDAARHRVGGGAGRVARARGRPARARRRSQRFGMK